MAAEGIPHVLSAPCSNSFAIHILGHSKGPGVQKFHDILISPLLEGFVLKMCKKNFFFQNDVLFVSSLPKVNFFLFKSHNAIHPSSRQDIEYLNKKRKKIIGDALKAGPILILCVYSYFVKVVRLLKPMSEAYLL